MNSHEDKKLVVFETCENIAVIGDGYIIIGGERYPYKVPIVDGLIGFLQIDLGEMDELFGMKILQSYL